MKRRFTWGLSMALIGILIVLGCSNGTTEVYTSSTIHTMAAPTVKAVAYQGGNIVTWTAVPNAGGYQVIRNGNGVSVAVAKNLSSTQLYYEDVIGGGEVPLVNGKEYNYTVIVESVTNDWFEDGENGIQNSRADSNRVLASIPATLDYAAITNLKVDRTTGTVGAGWDYYKVTWELVETNPLISYHLEYLLGGGASDVQLNATKDDANYSLSIDNVSPNSGYYLFPGIGGRGTIRIVPQFKNAYYSEGTVVSKDVDYKANLGNAEAQRVIQSFTATREDKSNATKTQVKLTYKLNPSLTADTVDELTFTIYRVKTSTSGAVIGTWEKVTDPTYAENGLYTKVVYNAVAATESYKYVLVIGTAAGTYEPVTATAVGSSSSSLRDHDLTVTSVLDTNYTDIHRYYYQYKENDKIVNKYDIVLTWTPQAGETYEIYRSPAGDKDLTAWTKLNYTADEVAPTDTNVLFNTNEAYHVDKDVTLRQPYKYKLVSTLNGVEYAEEKGIGRTVDPVQFPFAETIPDNLVTWRAEHYYTSPTWSYGSSGWEYRKYIAFYLDGLKSTTGDGNSFPILFGGESIEIWRTPLTTNGSGVSTETIPDGARVKLGTVTVPSTEISINTALGGNSTDLMYAPLGIDKATNLDSFIISYSSGGDGETSTSSYRAYSNYGKNPATNPFTATVSGWNTGIINYYRLFDYRPGNTTASWRYEVIIKSSEGKVLYSAQDFVNLQKTSQISTSSGE